MAEKRIHLIREVVETIALTLLIFLIVRFAGQTFRVDGESMEPGLQTSQFVLVDKVSYLFSSPRRGDVIVFHYPLDTQKDFIKRIIGIPGDTIRTTIDTVSVDGVMINEPYIKETFNFESRTWKLGPRQYFVMGDNRGNSLDSRSWGPLDRSYIVGRAIAVFWPPGNAEWINTYPTVFATISTNH